MCRVSKRLLSSKVEITLAVAPCPVLTFVHWRPELVAVHCSFWRPARQSAALMPLSNFMYSTGRLRSCNSGSEKKKPGTSGCCKSESGTRDQLIVVCTAQTTVTTEDDHTDVLHPTLLQQWQLGSATALQAADTIAENNLMASVICLEFFDSCKTVTELSSSMRDSSRGPWQR